MNHELSPRLVEQLLGWAQYLENPNVVFASTIPGKSFVTQGSPLLEIAFQISGFSKISVGNLTFNTKPGDIWVMNAHFTNSGKAISEGPWKIMCISFSVHSEIEFSKQPFWSKNCIGYAADIVRAYDECFYNFGSSQFYGFLKMKCAFLTLLVQIAEHLSEEYVGAHSLPVQTTLNLIKNRYSDPDLSISMMADNACLSTAQLGRLFLKATGLSPYEYLLRYRIDKALVLVRTGRFTIRQVSQSVGFNDALHFSKTFKRVKGKTPSQSMQSDSYGNLTSYQAP